MLPDITLLQQIIEARSITPNDHGCIPLIEVFLNQSATYFNRNQTSNAYLEIGTEGPLLLFVGHTDVVSPGPESQWNSPPFSCSIKDGIVTGRGIVDMKGAIWAFCSALKACPQSNLRIGILLTSDEEGDGKDGLVYAIDKLYQKDLKAAWALVGEPTSQHTIGDTYKHQRRGSYMFEITLHGKQGHSAYPELANNPSKQLPNTLKIIHDINNQLPDTDNVEIYSINSSTHVSNIIPKEIKIGLNLRYLQPQSPQIIQQTLKAQNICINSTPGAKPYKSNPKQLKKLLTEAIYMHTKTTAASSITGGTSDARFLAPIAQEIIEFGLLSATAHHINEQCPVKDLLTLRSIYLDLITSLSSIKIEKSDNK